MRANFGGAANLFCNRKRALKELVECGAQSTGVGCGAYGVLHLTQNLGFTQHHGVEPAGHPKRMARGIVFLQGVSVGLQSIGTDAARVGEPVQGLLDLFFVTCAVNFSAVAGRQNSYLAVMRHRLAQTI